MEEEGKGWVFFFYIVDMYCHAVEGNGKPDRFADAEFSRLFRLANRTRLKQSVVAVALPLSS